MYVDKRIKVLIVDDSSFIRHALRKMLQRDPDIHVVGDAVDPYDAREKIKLLNPDVLTLDIQMPKMDGIAFLERLMALHPMPVVMVSTLTQKGADITLKALELGAVDYITKPTTNLFENLSQISAELCLKVKTAYRAKIRTSGASFSVQTENAAHQKIAPGRNYSRFVLIGASTGGVEALVRVLETLPEKCPPILMVQHMPEKFTTSFAVRLNRICKPSVFEAQDGMAVHSNCIYLAPGNFHMMLEKNGLEYRIKLHSETLVSGHRPSVDYLFESALPMASRNLYAVILTGMGHDGAQGMKKLKDAGAMTFGQNEETCVVYGMPRAAKEMGAVLSEKPLNQIATTFMLDWKD